VASDGGTGRTLQPDNMGAGPACYGMTDTMGRMHSDAQFAGSSSVPAHVEMMGLIGRENSTMVGASVAAAVAIDEAMPSLRSRWNNNQAPRFNRATPRCFGRVGVLGPDLEYRVSKT